MRKASGGLENVVRVAALRDLEILKCAKIPFLAGGPYAMHQYAGIPRGTKGLDLFLKP